MKKSKGHQRVTLEKCALTTEARAELDGHLPLKPRAARLSLAAQN